ncbi:aquaporin-9-like isoform X1 [Mytilus edulis]|uniref:aquaporin-9-like isoform X1 n=2 Tax=Mytilus edulis TaxID=6550 RepID=UPI0039EFD9E8
MCKFRNCNKMEGFSSKVRIRNNIIRETFAEFLGTFTLIIFGDGSVAQAVLSRNTVGNHMSIHWSWGIGVTMGVYIAGGISGGHLNPAVTVALACIKKVPWKKVPFYMLGQYLGAFVASVTIYFVYYDALNSFDGGNRMVSGPNGTAGIWATYPQDFASVATCIGDQLLGTAMLLCCVLAVTDDRNMETHKGLIPFSIGLIVVVIGMTYHLNCGYAINPARDLGPRIFTAIAGWGVEVFSYNDYKYFWIPVLGPHVGAILGAFLYQFLIGFHWSEVVEITSDIPIKEIKNTVVTEKAEHTYDNRSLSPDS